MIVQLVLTLVTVAYLSYDQSMYKSKAYKYCEIASEYLLLLTSALI